MFAPSPHIIKIMVAKGDQNDFMFLTIFLKYAFAMALILYVCPLVESFKHAIILGPMGESECFSMIVASVPVANGWGGQGGQPPPNGHVKVSQKKDGRRRQAHRFHVCWPPTLPYPIAGFATAVL